jgi:hypothetical protein
LLLLQLLLLLLFSLTLIRHSAPSPSLPLQAEAFCTVLKMGRGK